MKRCIILFMFLLILTGCSGNQTAINSQVAEPTKDIEKTEAKNTASDVTMEKYNKSQESQESQISSKLDKNVINTPVLIKGYLLGGLSKGKWIKRDEFYNSKIVNLNEFKYDVYKNDKKTCTAYGGMPINSYTGDTLNQDKHDEEFNMVNLHDEENKNIDYDIAIKANWNLFPRKYRNQNTNQKNYDSLVKKFLEEEGLVKPVTALKQVIRVDLDGDGTEEVLISADNTVNDQFEQVKKGDNAIIIFRKIVDGKVIDKVVEKDIRLEDDKDVSIYRQLFRIQTIADLDGDEIMEVIIHQWYYEGESWGIYKLKENKLVLIAINGGGA